MNFSVSSLQPYSILEKADEVYVKYPNRAQILDFTQKIPRTNIVLEVSPLTTFDPKEMELWHMYDETFDSFTIALRDWFLLDQLNKEHIKWFWPYPITSFYELDRIVKLGASQVLIQEPLTFNLDTVRDIVPKEVQIRMIANVAENNYIPHLPGSNGLRAQWVRPEDVDRYERYVDIIQFQADTQEEAELFHIYNKGHWRGNLNFLLKNFNVDVDNRFIPNDLIEARMNCGQRCFLGSGCRQCERAIDFANNVARLVQQKND